MLSRVADSLYWMSRNLERADNVARFMEVNMHLVLDMELEKGAAQWSPLVQTSDDEADFNARYGDATEENVVHFLTFDEQNPNSIIRCIQNARENARTVREVIPSELWESMNELYHRVQKHSRKKRIGDLQGFYKDFNTASHLFAGFADNIMLRGQGWHFVHMGRMLERADKTARILDVKYFLLLPQSEQVGSTYDAVQWGALLKSVTGFEMYRKQYHRVHHQDVCEFLIFSKEFPRSMAFCVRDALQSLDAILALVELEMPAARKEMEKLNSMLAETDVASVLSDGLHEFIDRFQYQLNVVDQLIFESFFKLRP